MKSTISLILNCFFIASSCAQQQENPSTELKKEVYKHPLQTADVQAQKQWVDSVYASMTLQEKIGQLFMVQAFSNKDIKHENTIYNLVDNHHVGGIIFSKGGPYRQAKLNNRLQKASKTPLLIGMDAEWGLSMRLDSTYAFPWNMTLGAIQDNTLIEKIGKHIGEHNRRLGVHFNFAPVVDINTNPKNPIIGNRSFGEDKHNVTQKALAFMKGMQGAGVLANAKHFPGHGDTEADSHKTLPTIHFDRRRIDSVELYPYKKLIKEGLSSVMVAHLNVPALEQREGYPSSLSKTIVTDILKEKLGFEGLIYTDALEMKGVANFSESGDINLQAFLAGNDVLLMSEDVEKGVAKLTQAYNNKTITEARLAHSVKKILMAKYKVGLDDYKPVSLKNLHGDLNRLGDDILYEELMENAITVVKNQNNLLPIGNLDTKSIAYVEMGDDSGSTFYNTLKKYTRVHKIQDETLGGLLSKLNNYNTVIVGFHKSNASPWKGYKFSQKELKWLREIAKSNTVILDVFTKPYVLNNLKSFANIKSIIVSYQNSEIAQETSAEILFGALPAKGKLPVSAGPFQVGRGVDCGTLGRLGYTVPERVGMSTERLKRLDDIANKAVNGRMTPGIQLLVARHGKVVYNKNYGYHTYKKQIPVKDSDLYDIASLTKITATLPLLMELEEQGIVSLNSKLAQLLPEYQTSNKATITLKQMLSHYARLKPWIPFYFATLDSVTKKPDPKYYRKHFSKEFSVKVANELYLRSDYPDSIQKTIKETDLLSRLRYRYSDLPYYILKKIIEKHHNKPLDELVQDHFYRSLGANYTLYKPNNRFSMNAIAPTEEDDYFRYQTIQGYVHDMGAAMQGGVGGHAGVFSNANDMAKIMQMYLQKGYYGGRRYLRPETVDKFNTCYYCHKDNRRGVGFDKPQLGDVGPTCGCLSMKSFGHSGFTGTYVWADPDTEIVYVFMANRTYPHAERNYLLRENIRTDIQQLIYEAIVE